MKAMKLSERMSQLSASPTVALNVKAQELKAKGFDVLNFAVGEPDFGTPQGIVKKAIDALQAGHTRYGPAGGGKAFRKAIAAKLKRENKLEFDIDQIVCGIGAKELLFHLFLTLLNEGDEVLLTAPYWVSYQEQIKAAGGVPITIPLPEDREAPIIDLKTIEKYASERTVAYILCSPNNPAGYVLREQELRELGNYLATKPWWILSDEVYEYMAFDREHISLLSLLPELCEKYILINSFSKGFAMTGWRVGYTAGPQAVMQTVRSLQSHSSTCLPPFIEEAAIWAIEQGKALLTTELGQLKKRRDLALSCLKEIDGLSHIHPSGAFYLFVDLRDVLERSQNYERGESLAFCQHLLETQHLAVIPGEAFGAPGFLRFSYACDEATIREGFKRLRQAVEALS